MGTNEIVELLNNPERRNLCIKIVQKELQEKPEKIIKAHKLLSLSEEITEVFPNEHVSTYFISYMNYGKYIMYSTS